MTVMKEENTCYAPEAHIMYLTVSSSFLISFVMGKSGPSRVIKYLIAPEQVLLHNVAAHNENVTG
jgi:hypothetical protein